ncbi:MAG: four helix bundle protein [Bacteroidota bacterium]
MANHGFTSLEAFVIAENLAQEIFNISQSFPKEERYSLTDQIRRSSRSVCSSLAESYAKRRYPKHFIAKLSDALGENFETITWLRFARHCHYIDNETYLKCEEKATQTGKLLNFMIKNPSRFGSLPHKDT